MSSRPMPLATTGGRWAPLPVRLALLLALLLSTVAGCSGTLLPKPPAPPARFTLDATRKVPPPAVPPSAGPSPTAQSIAVSLPRAAPGYDSRHMLYQRRPQELEAFAFHEWVETPAQMLAPLLVRALQDSGAFRVVLLAPSAALAGWRLESELIRLHQDFGSRPSQVRLGLRAVLLDGASRQVIAWREFDLGVAATSDDPVAGVQAAHRAAQQLMQAVADFCAEQVRGTSPNRYGRAGPPDG